MEVRVVSQIDHQYLGWERLPDNLAEIEIENFFTLSINEQEIVSRRRRSLNRLGVALQIGYFRLTGLPMKAVEMIPPQILAHVGRQLAIAAPHLASIRALYRRRRTLFEHQSAAKAALGLRDLSPHAERSLTAFLRREAGERHAVSDLVIAGRSWLADHKYLQIPARRLKSLANAARRHFDTALFVRATEHLSAEQVDSWRAALLETMDNGKTRIEWLRDGPASRRPRALANHMDKIDFLKGLGANRLDLDVSTTLLKAMARPMLYRKPATLRRMRAEKNMLEIACFLRLQLLRLTDDGIGMIDYRIADMWRQARNRAEDAMAQELRRYQRLVLQLVNISDNDEISPSELRDQLRAILQPFALVGTSVASTQVGRIRAELVNDQKGAIELLRATAGIGLDLPLEHPLRQALATLDHLEAIGANQLPEGTANPFGATWGHLVDQIDRRAALAAYRSASLMLLKRALRNGQASVRHSLEHRAPDDRLIPITAWRADRTRLVRELALSTKPEATIDWIKDELTLSMSLLDDAIREGHIRIENGRLVVPKVKTVDEDEQRAAIRRALFAGVGKIQLPDLLVEVDAQTRFSWILLGRPPHSEQELVILYAALIALGSDMTASDLARMTLGLSADAVGEMMKRIEARGTLPEANLHVLDSFRALPIAQLWGAGIEASADMMSLDATRYHWAARQDPRRQTPAIGTYTHILDQWAILHDQPIILNKRQAGAAIEGALRHEQVQLDRVAVDTHGFTHFAMAIAKMVGFDLCPRLAQLSDRKLYLPRGLAVPISLKPIVRETVSSRAISKGWDPLQRIAASVKLGWCSATYVLDRFGSAAHGELAFKAGDAFGRLLRTRYLATYLGNSEFRASIHALLSQGEAVHTLQRAIHSGPIGSKRGRTPEQMAAISSALTLLTNAVMTWNASRIGEVRATAADAFPDHHVRHIAPIAHAHINMRGVLTFNVTRFWGRLGNAGNGAAQLARAG